MLGFFVLNLDATVDQLCKSLDCQSVVFTRRSGNLYEIYQLLFKEQCPFDKFINISSGKQYNNVYMKYIIITIQNHCLRKICVVRG